jgi:hypothetical protein
LNHNPPRCDMPVSMKIFRQSDLRSTCDSYKESPKKELMMKGQKIIKTEQEKKNGSGGE